MAMDWKDALAALGASGTLPEGEETAQEETQGKTGSQGGKLHIELDRKGRKGKTATIIYGFTGNDEEVAETAKRSEEHTSELQSPY